MSRWLLRVTAVCLPALRIADATAECAFEDKDTPALLQTKVNFPQQDTGNVLYMVKSYHGNYETRLHAVLQTWGSTLTRSSLVVLGDDDFPEFPIAKATMCGSDATVGLSCRVAYGFTVAARHPGNWSWLVVVDDDHYLRPKLVEEKLAQYDASKLIGAGCYGCGKKYGSCDGHGGFCGGCGYAFSRPAVMAMVGRNATEFQAFHEETMLSGVTNDRREDMAISCVMRKRLPELEIQKFSCGEMDKTRIGGRHWATCGWHHVSPEQMVELHSALKDAA